MSVELKKLVDARIDSAAALTAIHDAVLGPSNIVSQTFKPTSASSSTLDFVIQTPGLAVYMSRKVLLNIKIPFKFKIRNYANAVITPDVSKIVPGINIGPCAYPVNSMVQTATVQISTSSFTTQVQQTLPLVKRLLQRPSTRRAAGVTESGLGDTAPILQPNASSYFQNAVESGNDPKAEMCYGNNVQSHFKITKYTDMAGNVLPNNGVQPANYDPDGKLLEPVDTWVYGYMDPTEPLLCQPFEIDEEMPAFINVNLISVRLNLSPIGADLCRLVRFAAPPMIKPVLSNGGPGQVAMPAWQPFDLQLDGTAGAEFAKAMLTTQFMSPPPTAVVPTKCIYPTTYMNPLPTGYSNGADAMPAKTEIASTVITLNTAPDAIAIYYVPQIESPGGMPAPFRPVDGGRALAIEDYVSYISNIDITWNNNPSLLRTFGADQLWARSFQNGLPQSRAVYGQNLRDTDLQFNPTFWVGGAQDYAGAYVVPSSGGCILLALNKDIPVEPGVAAGVAGVYTLQVKATITNLLPAAKGTLYVVPVSSQYLILNAGATSDLLTTVATEEQVASTPTSGEVQDKALVGGAKYMMAEAARASRGGTLSHVIDARGGYAVGAGAPQSVMGSAGAASLKRARGDMYM